LFGRLFDADEFADVDPLALASPLAPAFTLGDVELARPLVVDNAPFVVDSPLDTTPFALDAAEPAAPAAALVRLDVSVLPLAEPLAFTGPAFAPVAPEAEPEPLTKPLA
jgi:hypothetical protein